MMCNAMMCCLPACLPPPSCAADDRPPGDLGRCRLDEVGYGVGVRLLEVLSYRERAQRRETRLLEMLKFVHRCVGGGAAVARGCTSL